jgi:hypothetical protein
MQYDETRKLPPIKPNQKKHKTIHFHTLQEEPRKGNNRPEFYSVTNPQTKKKQKTL